jgi:predicted amidohydrolase
MNSGIDPEANLATIAHGVEEAAQEGARILFTPEMSLLLDRNRTRGSAWIDSAAPGEALAKLADMARAHGIDIALGSLPIGGSIGVAGGKWANRSCYFSHTGAPPVFYDKIHMFDVDLASGESWRESNAYQAGSAVVSIEDTPLGRLGLTVCYDLRFPALFAALGDRCCDAIAVPAAFTRPTGVAHWHVMLRARAIEASAYVIAAAQVGTHQDGRETYGHSLVVDPWGEVLLDLGGEAPALGYGEIDPERIAAVRAQVPSLANRRALPTSVTP